MKFFTFHKISKKQCNEFGQVCALVLLVLFVYFNQKIYISIAVIVLLLNLTIPLIFYPFAIVWFWLAEKISTISSAILLSIIFFVIVVPAGLIRRLTGKDNLSLKQFKKSKSSVMITRNHVYSKEDLLHSF
jgi:hypothetical protein